MQMSKYIDWNQYESSVEKIMFVYIGVLYEIFQEEDVFITLKFLISLQNIAFVYLYFQTYIN